MTRTNEQLAHTLNYLIEQRLVPGLLPVDVSAAAERLIEQSRRIEELEAILAANKHTVTATMVPTDDRYRSEIRVRLDIVDPRPYYGQIRVGYEMLLDNRHDYEVHIARTTLRAAFDEMEQSLLTRAVQQVAQAMEQARKRAQGDTQ